MLLEDRAILVVCKMPNDIRVEIDIPGHRLLLFYAESKLLLPYLINLSNNTLSGYPYIHVLESQEDLLRAPEISSTGRGKALATY